MSRRIGALASSGIVLVIALASLYTAHKTTPRWTPDASAYTVRALQWSGSSPEEAVSTVKRVWHEHHVATYYDNPPTIRFSKKFALSLYRPRILYPGLSAPFVALLGVNGMLVLPVLCWLFTLLALHRVASRVTTDSGALGAVALIAGSVVLSQLGAEMLTDAPLLAELSLLLLLLPLGVTRTKRHWVAAGLVVGLIGLTRQAAPLAVAPIALTALVAIISARSWRTAWTPFAAAAVVVGAAVSVWGLHYSGLSLHDLTAEYGQAKVHRAEGNLDYYHLVTRAFTRDWDAVMRDRALLVFFVLALIGLARASREAITLTVGGIIGVCVLEAANPTPTGARILSECAPFLVVSAAWALSRRHQDRSDPATEPSRTGEPAPAV